MFGSVVPSADADTAPGAQARNRLADTASPYLRQHAANPVDWYPWGEDAFAKAKRENKPIFLSVGYATCYWCHVMARESFANDEIGALMNESVVSIKVDRERRPDVDQTYMLATEIIAKHGGWPNSVFLTPDLKPFYAATYLPPDEFKRVVGRVADLWRERRADLERDADRISGAISQILGARIAAQSISPTALEDAQAKTLAEFDHFNGGFGTAPKFPREPLLLSLLDAAHRHAGGDGPRWLQAATLTLDSILAGGMNDQLAGGFHRYAVDNEWRVPHFEKMLYDQALLVSALVDAYRLTGQSRYARGVKKTLDFALAGMTAPEGGFYSAIDAESEGREGAYYVWTPDTVLAALGSKADADFAMAAFGVTADGNLEGESVLHLAKTPEELAAAFGLSVETAVAWLGDVRMRLLAARNKRPAPERDEKVLTAWNGLMIAALAKAGLVLAEPRYVEAAERAARFIVETMRSDDGGLKRSYFEGRAELPGTQPDYAFLALGLIALTDATGDRNWLDQAKQLAGDMVKRFQDPQAGDFYLAEADQNAFVRAKSRTDAELPSGNAAALELFARLDNRDDSPEWQRHADRLMPTLAVLAQASPAGNAYSFKALAMARTGETGPVWYAGKGHVRAKLVSGSRPGASKLRLTMAPGWHINAHRPLDDLLIATTVSGRDGQELVSDYPEPLRRQLSFQDQALALYEGTVDLPLTPGTAVAPGSALSLRLQVCSDKICLAPETIKLTAPSVLPR